MSLTGKIDYSNQAQKFRLKTPQLVETIRDALKTFIRKLAGETVSIDIEKKELIDQLKFDEWLESDEAMQLKAEREHQVIIGKTMTLDQMKEKLRAHGKNI
jgi:hypothetical protein